MAELERVIEQADIPGIEALLETVFRDRTYADLKRLGGMTNRSYRVTRKDGASYLVRLPGEGTQELVNRADEKKSTMLACKLNIDAELLHFGDDGTKVMRFIKDPQPMNDAVLRKPETIAKAADIFRTLHGCGEDTGVRFEVFEMAESYEQIIRAHGVALFEDFDEISRVVGKIKKEIDVRFGTLRVPCHNDSLVDNWVLSGDDTLYLVDWEYSGMNDPMWDLSCLSIEAAYEDPEDTLFLQTYLGQDAGKDDWLRFMAHKLYVDYLWTLWGKTRVPYDGEFMEEYARNRYERLKRNLEKYYQLEEVAE